MSVERNHVKVEKNNVKTASKENSRRKTSLQKQDTAQVAELLEKVKLLEAENRDLKKLVSSKRFKFAEKIATMFNLIFPIDTRRRKVVVTTVRGLAKISAWWRYQTTARIAKKLQKLARTHEKIFVINNVLWEVKLKQRSQHLAVELRDLGFFVVYLEEDNVLNKFRVVGKNIVTINNKMFLKGLAGEKTGYFLTPNNLNTTVEDLEWVKEQGFEIVYDFLDEFHEDISEDLSAQLEVWQNLQRIQPILYLATAQKLYEQLVKHLGSKEKVLLLQNAVNVEDFDFTLTTKEENPPGDLEKILETGQPVIGFYGALAPWTDYDLLNWLGETHPEWQFVYIGVDYHGAAQALTERKNVHKLGSKNYTELRKYTRYFNCALIPFKAGEIAKATSPIKLFEYMAAGLPTVCTRDLEECKGYQYVYISKNAEEFEKNIAKALTDYNNPAARKKLLKQAREHTWKKRAEDLVKRLEK